MRFWEFESVGEEGAAGGVCRALHRRGSQAQHETLGPLDHELVSRGAGLDVKCQEDVGTVLLDGWWRGSHLRGVGRSGWASRRSRCVLRRPRSLAAKRSR
jgi:hypothetical protein